MEELIKKLKEAGKSKDVLASEESLRAAAKEVGYTDEEFEKILAELPLDDDALENVAGGKFLNVADKLFRSNLIVPMDWRTE